MSKSKYYEVTDPEALQAFNPKAVKLVPQYDNALILRMLRDFDNVPGVKRLGAQEAVPPVPGVQNTPES